MCIRDRLSGKRTLLVIVTGVMLAVLAGMLLLRKMPRLERAAWILVVGGGVGNLIDRIRTGVVVDYLNCLFINFPVFNFADVCICVGVGPVSYTHLDVYKRQDTNGYFVSSESAAPVVRDPTELDAMSPADLQQMINAGETPSNADLAGHIVTGFSWRFYAVCSACLLYTSPLCGSGVRRGRH